METRVRAIIIQNEKVLLIHRIKENDEYWVFPGGGVEETDENPEGALGRECMEELGIKVKVGELFISNQIELQGKERREIFFFCEQISGVLGTGTGPEYHPDSNYSGAYSLEWVDLARLSLLDVRPKDIQQKLLKEVE